MRTARAFHALIIGTILVNLLGCLGPSHQAADSLSAVQQVDVARAKQIGATQVALVHSYHGKTRPMCTGTFVAPHIILTANHCVEGLAERLGVEQLLEQAATEGMEPEAVGLLLSLGMVETPYVDPMTANFEYLVQSEAGDMMQQPLSQHASQVKILSKRFDLALLYTVGEEPTHALATLASSTPLVGEDIYLMGQPQGAYWTYMTGVVSAYRLDMSGLGMEVSGPFIQVQAPMWHGNSGGGIFNTSGQLVGMADFISPAPDMGFGTHLETIRGYLLGQHLITLSL